MSKIAAMARVMRHGTEYWIFVCAPYRVGVLVYRGLQSAIAYHHDPIVLAV